MACWFATRLDLANPVVLTAIVQPDEILCCVNDRREREFIVRPSAYERLQMSQDEIKQGAEEWSREREKERLAAIRQLKLRHGS